LRAPTCFRRRHGRRELLIWAGVIQLRHRTSRVSLVVLSSRPRTGFVFCRCAFILLPFAAASGHGTMVLSVGWPPVLLLPRTGRSFFLFIESCSSVCYRVPLLLLCVFSCFSVLSPWLDCCVSSNGRCICFVSTLRHRTVTKGKACDMKSRHGSSETPQEAVQATQSCRAEDRGFDASDRGHGGGRGEA